MSTQSSCDLKTDPKTVFVVSSAFGDKTDDSAKTGYVAPGPTKPKFYESLILQTSDCVVAAAGQKKQMTGTALDTGVVPCNAKIDVYKVQLDPWKIATMALAGLLLLLILLSILRHGN